MHIFCLELWKYNYERIPCIIVLYQELVIEYKLKQTDFERICVDFENHFVLSEKNEKFCNQLISAQILSVSQIIGGGVPPRLAEQTARKLVDLRWPLP